MQSFSYMILVTVLHINLSPCFFLTCDYKDIEAEHFFFIMPNSP